MPNLTLNMWIFLCLVFTIFTSGYCYDEFDIIDPTKAEEDTHLDVEDFMNFEEIDSNPLVEILRRRNFDPDVDQTLTAGRAEGDIALPPGVTLQEFVADMNDETGRNAVRSRYMRWRNGEIPYAVSSKYGSLGRKLLGKAMDVIHSKTCVRFVPRDHQNDYIYIAPIDGCFSHVGRQGGRQLLSLESGCFQVGTIVHELIHAIGFFHEQSRNDRDEYIEIHWDNIAGNNEDQFEKYSLYQIDHLNTGYHYGSLMHYDEYAFSTNRYRYKTITPLKPTNGQKLGQRKGPTDIDILRINMLYRCPEIATARPNVKPTDAAVTNCADRKRLCPYWKNVGYCQSHEAYMKKHCAKVCEFCGTDSEGPAHPPTPPPPVVISTGPQCKDHNGNCGKWKKKGYCRKYSSYMEDKCQKSCSNCKSAAEAVPDATIAPVPVSGQCEDKFTKTRCNRYARMGACTAAGRDGRSMREHCKASCGLCESPL